MKKLSIIIVNYNVKYFLEQCLYSVRAAISNMDDIEIFVVDNNSSDCSFDYLSERFPEVVFIVNKDNLGFAKANNIAIEQSIGEYILLLNPDTIIGEDLLRTAICFLDDHKQIGGLGVKMIDNNGKFLVESKRSFPTPWVSFCKIFGLSKLYPNSRKFAKYNLSYLNEDKPHYVEVLAGACLFTRRSVIDRIGLLDEAFFMYGEDIDFSYRIVEAGYKNYYLPERILHYKGESSKQNDQRYIKSFYGAMDIFYRKYYSDNNPIFSKCVRFAIYTKALLSTLYGKFGLKEKDSPSKGRIQVISTPNHFEEIKELCRERFPSAQIINHWNLDILPLNRASSRQNQMMQYTDMVFCHPDLRFEQILLFMDKSKNKNITYHIYDLESKTLN